MKSVFVFFLFTFISLVADKPNVVVILTDDQGWGDLSLTGNKDLETPYIDSIGKDGAIFENFYVAPVCSPTRA
ncbi:MAG: sulfatase-like hydrolase/transferase, partial [Lentisphaeraceae bacterium]|nr:sulfatase-like hydrolase/transferase [Lentisphaeraceae bacterium]